MASGNGTGISGTSVVIVLAGAILSYSGLKGKHISDTIRSLIAGKTPSGSPDLPIGQVDSSGIPSAGPDAGNPGTQRTGGDAYTDVLNFLTPKWPKVQVAGAMGNMQIESGFDPSNPNPNEGAIGLCQWEGGRRVALRAYASARRMTETDVRAQLGYMMVELTTAYAPVYLAFRAATTPASAAAIWDAGYEVSDGSARQQRIDAANTIYKNIGGK